MFKNIDTLEKALAVIDEQNEILHVANELVQTASWFVYYNSDGGVTRVRWGDEMRQLFGFSDRSEFPDELEPFANGLHPDDLERIFKNTNAEAFDGGFMMTEGMEFRFLTKNNGYQWFRSMGKLQRDEKGRPLRFLGLTVNITKQHEYDQMVAQNERAYEALRHEVAQMDVVHEMLGSGRWSMDFDESGKMKSVTWSDEFRHMLGYQGVEDFPDKLESWSDLLHSDDKERVLLEYQETINDYSGTKIYDVEYRLLTKDRGYRWYRAIGKPTRRPDGTPITYVGMFVDITAQKELDFKLEEQRRLLEEALDDARAASEAKTTFLFNMSHDIRTPMNAIIGYTNLARRPETSESDLHSYLDKIASSSQHLLALINDVLEMSRIESGKMDLELSEVDLGQLLDGVYEMFGVQMQRKRIDFTVDYSQARVRRVLCDENRLNRVLLNLLSNAYKFTPEDGTVSVVLQQVEGASTGNAAYELRVKDSGIGMSSDFAQKVFDAFERERTSTVSGIQGTGLGMAITKSIIDLMGGSIDVVTAPGRGTEFVIRFELAVVQADAEEPVVPQEPDGSGQCELNFSAMRLLLVEDNEINREIAALILEEVGFTVETAVNGKEAVERIAISQPGYYDVVLMDVQMPVMDGYEATRAIRALSSPGLAEIPIIATTANAFAEDVRAAREAGMDGHIAKPLDVPQMLDVLTRVLGGRRTGVPRNER